jgi:hypothetical protein
MNSAQAKKIPLQEILSRLGLQPVKAFKGGSELAYLSPFRNEKEPSLFVNIQKNVWYDFGDIGGNTLDFIIRYRNTDVKGGLEFLDQMFGKGFVLPLKPANYKKIERMPQEEVFTLIRVAEFGANIHSLMHYITVKRGINPEIASRYLQEVHFTNREKGKTYFAVGFKNLSGGYEIRNPFFKSSLGSKDMSFVKGSGAEGEILVFEGFMDFLSKLTLDEVQAFSADALILNSVSYAEKAIFFIREKGYQKLKGYLDNDRAGNEATERFKSEFDEAFSDMRSEYQVLKDLNEYLTSN